MVPMHVRRQRLFLSSLGAGFRGAFVPGSNEKRPPRRTARLDLRPIPVVRVRFATLFTVLVMGLALLLAACGGSGKSRRSMFPAAAAVPSAQQSGSGVFAGSPDAPKATVATPAGVLAGDIPIAYDISDPQSDLATVAVSFSRDGGRTFSPATRSTQSAGTWALLTSPAGTSYTFTWDSATDLGAVREPDVRIRIWPSDAQPGTPADTADFIVDNTVSGSPPQATMIGLAGTWRGVIDLDYTVLDADSDPVDIIVTYSTDGGQTYRQATKGPGGDPVQNLTTTPTGNDYTFMWDSIADLGTSQVYNDVQVTITPYGPAPGTPATTGSFKVDNRGLSGGTGGPNLTSLSPTQGPVGRTVSVYGTGFDPVATNNQVSFNGTSSPVYFTISGGIVTSVPQGATTGSVTVTVQGRTSNALPFTVVPTASLTALSPSSGPVGTVVTFFGRDFSTLSNGIIVRFPGHAGFSVTATSSTEVRATVPAGAMTGDVTVFSDGIAATNKLPFTVTTGSTPPASAPQVTLTTPPSPQSGNVTLSYTILDAQSDPSSITVHYSTDGGQTFLIAKQGGGDPTTGMATSPAGITYRFVWDSVGDLGTTNHTGVRLRITPRDTQTGSPVSTGSFALQNAQSPGQGPTLVALNPSSGAIWASVRIEGRGFDTQNIAKNEVTFNGTPATTLMVTPLSSGNQDLLTMVPPGATSGNVTVTVNGLSSNGLFFTVAGNPTLTSITPSAGPVGSSIALKGTGFDTKANGVVVRFAGGASVIATASSATDISVTVPGGATSGNVSVVSYGAVSNGIPFTVQSTTPAPMLVKLTPTSGAIGDTVRIEGTGFDTNLFGNAIAFNGTVAAPMILATLTNGNQELTTVVPQGATTGSVTITASGRTSNGLLFTVTTGTTQPPSGPTLFALTPTLGAIGATVRIKGTNFDPTFSLNVIRFNGTQATPAGYVQGDLITSVPQGATSGPVTVAVNGQVSNSLTFTVIPDPVLLAITPSAAAVNDLVTLSGANFDTSVNGIVVRFAGGVSVIATATSTTSVSANVPQGAVTGDVYVVTHGATSNRVPFTVSTTTTGGGGGGTGGQTPIAQNAAGTLGVYAITPNTGYRLAYTPITITGFGFEPGTRVTIGNNNVRNLVVVDSTTMTGETERVAWWGPADVVLSNSKGQVTVKDGYTYNYNP